MSDSTFGEFRQQLTEHGVAAAIDTLVAALRAERKYHELFEALKMRLRHQHQLPVIAQEAPADETGLSPAYEDGLIEICREVGLLLLRDGRIREAWMYLRPVGDKATVLAALDETDIPEDRVDEVIEVCLYEGLDPVRAYRLMLDKYGTCNTLTTYESQQGGLDMATRQQVATLLVEHLYGELLGNLRAHVEREKQAVPEGTLAEILERHPWLTEGGNYHIDVSHLSATVRGARVVADPRVLELAWQLALYGSRLDATLQYADEEPFAENYPAHLRFYAALLGRNVDENLAYFQQRAAAVDPHYEGTGAIEFLIELLRRCGQAEQALQLSLDKLPPGTHTRGIAPPLLELARQADRLEEVAAVFRDRGDLLGYAAALLDGPSYEKTVRFPQESNRSQG